MTSVNCFACGFANESAARACRCGAQLPRFSFDSAPVVRDIAYAGETTTISFGSDLLEGLRRRQVLALEGVLSAEEFAEYLDVAGPAVLADVDAYLAVEEESMRKYRAVVEGVLGRPLTAAEDDSFEEYANHRGLRLETMLVRFEEAFDTLLDYCASGDAAQAQRGLYLAEQAAECYEGLQALQDDYVDRLQASREPVLAA